MTHEQLREEFEGEFRKFLMFWSAENEIWWKDGNTNWNLTNNEDATEKLIAEVLLKLNIYADTKLAEVAEEIEKNKFVLNVKEYLPLVKEWNGKNFDVPFDHGYGKGISDSASITRSKMSKKV